MASTFNISDTSANTMANAIAALFNNGFVSLYTGTQPANANTALSGNTLLVTMDFSATAWGSASGGIITLENIRKYALAGVDFISIGALTQSAAAVELSMRVTTDIF